MQISTTIKCLLVLFVLEVLCIPYLLSRSSKMPLRTPPALTARIVWTGAGEEEDEDEDEDEDEEKVTKQQLRRRPAAPPPIKLQGTGENDLKKEMGQQSSQSPQSGSSRSTQTQSIPSLAPPPSHALQVQPPNEPHKLLHPPAPPAELVDNSNTSNVNLRLRFSEAKLRHAEFAYCASQHMAKGKPLVALFTTMHPSKDPLKMLAQQNTLQAYANLAPLVHGIVFTKSVYWKEQAKKLNITAIEPDKNIMLNRHGTPFLFEMFDRAFQETESFFAAYANGDILFSEDFVTTLCSVKAAINHGIIRDRVLLVGKRLNHQMSAEDRITSDIHQHAENILNWAKTAELFFPNAQDYFVISKTTFRKASVPQWVIGRPAYDNCLVSMGVEDPDIDTVDGTLSIHAVHQTEAGGNFAGHTKKADSNWNLARCPGGWKYGSTDFCGFYSLFHNGKVTLLQRAAEELSEEETMKQNI